MKATLSIIVPVFNEAGTVGTVLQKLVKVKHCKEIVIVNDGSTDNSPRVIKRFLTQYKAKKSRSPALHYIEKPNGGKGSAIRVGLEHVTGGYTLIQDADCEYDPEDIALLMAPVLKGRAQVVYGSRFLGAHTNLLFWHRVGNHVLNFLVNILFNTTLSDMETCYKLLPTAVFKQLDLKANKFELEPEITCKVLKMGLKIYEVPITYSGRDFSEGKKITWVDGIHALQTIFTLRLTR
jgi:glycosyltransferase involved in cell wall biosynthesis